MHIVTDGSTLVLSGSFDARSTFQVRAAIYEHMNSAARDLVIDLSGVEFVDVTALKVLAVATRQASRNDQHLTLRGCNGAIRRLLHMTHLIRVVEVERVAATA